MYVVNHFKNLVKNEQGSKVKTYTNNLKIKKLWKQGEDGTQNNIRLCRSKRASNSIYKSSMHTSELCYCRLIEAKQMYARRSIVVVHFKDRDNTLAGSGIFTYNIYNHSNKMVNIMKVQ